MTGDLIALNTFMRTRVWAVHRPALSALMDAVLTAETVDGLASRVGVQATAPIRSRGGERGGMIGILPIMGVITARPSIFSAIFGWPTVTGLQAQFRDLLQDPDITAIVLLFDSPGGEAGLLPEFATELRASPKPITAVVSTLAASAAFWLASQAATVVITPSGMAGSIGVYLLHLDHSRQLDALGVTPTFISAGERKTDGNELEPLSARAKADLQADVNYVYGQFVGDVARGRRLSPARVTTDIQARLLNAPDAIRFGLVDRVDTFEGALALLTGHRSGRAALATSGCSVADEHAAIIAALSH